MEGTLHLKPSVICMVLLYINESGKKHFRTFFGVLSENSYLFTQILFKYL